MNKYVDFGRRLEGRGLLWTKKEINAHANLFLENGSQWVSRLIKPETEGSPALFVVRNALGLIVEPPSNNQKANNVAKNRSIVVLWNREIRINDGLSFEEHQAWVMEHAPTDVFAEKFIKFVEESSS